MALNTKLKVTSNNKIFNKRKFLFDEKIGKLE